MAGEAEDRRSVRRHGPEARAVLSLVVVGGVGKQIAGEAEDIVEVPRRPSPVVAGELRGRREPQPIAEARPADQPLLVDAGDGRREAVRPQREGRRVALGRVDRQARRPPCARRRDCPRRARARSCRRLSVPWFVCTPSIQSPSARSAVTRTPSFTVTPSVLLAPAGEVLDEEPRVPARVAEVADRAGDLPAHRLEDGIEPRERVRIQDLLPLPVLGEERHLSSRRLRAASDRGGDRARPGRWRGTRCPRPTRSFITAWLYWQRRSLMSVLRRDALRRALAQEPQPPGVEPRVGPEPQADRVSRRRAATPTACAARAATPTRTSGRGDDPGIARRGLEADAVLLLEDRHLVAGLGEEVRRRDADDPAAEDEGLHVTCARSTSARGRARPWTRARRARRHGAPHFATA